MSLPRKAVFSEQEKQLLHGIISIALPISGAVERVEGGVIVFRRRVDSGQAIMRNAEKSERY